MSHRPAVQSPYARHNRLLSLPVSVWALLASAGCDPETGYVKINNAPTVSITSPAEASVYTEGDTVSFNARVTDNQDPPEELYLVWESDIGGVLLDGDLPDADGMAVFATVSLTPGNHLIRLTAIDTEDAQGSDTVSISIQDLPDAPDITIIHPLSGEVGYEGEDFEFSALVEDEQDEPVDLLVEFASDADGVFCNPTPDLVGLVSCQESLSVGVHTLTFSVEDVDGYSASVQVFFEVISGLEVDDDGDGYNESMGDCDDSDSSVFPTAVEVCNSEDDDCDGEIDEDTVCSDDDGDGYTELESDCDDTLADTYPGAPETCDLRDNDCDGSYDEGTTCVDDDADGYTEIDGDCNDSAGYTYPGATEVPDYADNDCDGVIDEGTTTFDDDGDCFCEVGPCAGSMEPTCPALDGGDCDDGEAAVGPAATEACDAIDNDCDGTVDEDDAADAATWYLDMDGDGFGQSGSSRVACYVPLGYVANALDCDDGNGAISPSGTEVCDLVDNDCDSVVDDGVQTTYYLDADGDGYGNAASTTGACSTPAGYVADATDCDDTRSSVSPAGLEVCNSIDDDCDRSVDETDAADASTWYRDSDGDGYGSPSTTTRSCTVPSGYVALSTDCDDSRSTAFPGATEYCNAADDDCDGATDENDAADAATWYADADGDGYGNASSSTRACTVPGGYVADTSDCNDAAWGTHPGASESCDGADNDCDGSVDEGVLTTYYRDADGDGYGASTSTLAACSMPAGYVSNADDCNDADASLTPNTVWYIDYDADGYGSAAYSKIQCTQPTGYVSSSTDCNDATNKANPGATESCDSLDNDCDGATDEVNASGCSNYYYDYDGDGYGVSTSYQCLCASSGYYRSRSTTDCYDGNASAYPGQTSYFSTNRGDGSYDYNCDGAQTRKDTGTWSCTGAVYVCIDYDNGWSSVPSCGVTGTWKEGCSASFTSCSASSSYSKTQSCL